MEFSFNIPGWLHLFLDEPIYIVLVASFGVIAAIAVFIFLFSLLGKLFLKNFFEKLIVLVASSLTITLIIGFVTMMLFLFGGVSPIKMILIWVSMIIVYFLFSIINFSKLEKYLSVPPKNK